MENRAVRKRFSTRAFTSLLLTCTFVVTGLSGVMLYLSPRGRVANWTDWTLAGLGKEQWSALHVNSCLLFLLVTGLHLVLNWKPFWGYLKKRASFGINRKGELALALVLAVGIVAGTLYGLPPFSTIVAWQDEIKDYWEVRSAPAPVPHSEELTLAEFAGQINLSTEEVSEALRTEGYEFEDPTITMAQLADRQGVPPSIVFAAIEKHFPDAAGFAGRGQGRGFGRGRMGGAGGRCSEPSHAQDAWYLSGPSSEAAASLGESGNGGSDEAASGADAEGNEPAASTGAHPEDSDGQGPGSGRGLGWGRGRGEGFGQGRGRGGGQGFGRGYGRRWAEE
jgi:hypothetical protein